VTLGTNPGVVEGKISTTDRRVNDKAGRDSAPLEPVPWPRGGLRLPEAFHRSMGIVAMARALPARTPGVSLGEHD